ncbi:MAG: hypothetical protein JSS21_08510 [Proteobacteria bacterium]|nr:hypothetical protein [Pseudomonadota bacterium]
MEEWPAWQRWGTWLFGWVLYAGAFWMLFVTANVAVRIAALAGIGAGLLVLTYSSRAVLNERVRKIDRWQLHVTLPAFLAYMLLMLYVWPLAAHIATPWLKAIVAISPALPLAFVAWAMIRYVNRCDEMERRQHLEAAGISVVVVSLGSMVLGFLAAVGLIRVNGALVLLFILPTLCVAYGLACTWSKWRNRAR